MTAIDYTHFDTRRLGELLERSKHTEADFEDRLEARLKKRLEMGGADRAPNPDPVAKRLAFLAAKARTQRRAVEHELATRPRQNADQRSGSEATASNRCEEPTLANDNRSTTTRRMAPAVVA
jgi:hypothetical protein